MAGCVDLLGDCLGAGILGCRLVIIVNNDPLLTELVDLLPRLGSQRTLDIGSSIRLGRAVRVDRLPRNVGRRARCWRGDKGHSSSLIYAQFAPDDVEDGAIVKFIDAHTVALLLPTIDLEGALPRDDDTLETALVVVRELLPDLGAGVKESGRSRAESSDSGGGGGSGHGGIYVLAKTWYSTHVFPRR